MDTISAIFALFTVILSIGGGLCAVILPILILGGLGYFLYRRNQQSGAARQAAQSWPETKGTVLASSVHVSWTNRSRSETPVVVYQYEANGKDYQGKVIRAGDQFMSVRLTGQAQATVDRYPVGASVTVYYNPANPAESALER